MLRLPRFRATSVTFVGAFSVILAYAPLPAQAEVVTDPAGDFLGTYLGPKNGDMDAISSEVILDLDKGTFHFSATSAGAVGTTTTGVYVWGLDRGLGTQQFLNAIPGTPSFGAGVKFDSVIALFADQTGSFFDSAGEHKLLPGAVQVSGNTISATVPLDTIPSAGFAPANYTWNYWPESQFQMPRYVSDFAPDARNATLTVVPEPSTLFLVVFGFAGALAARIRRMSAV